MEPLSWLAVVGGAIGVMALFWWVMHEGGKWREIHASPALHPEPTIRRHSYLRARGVRCRLSNLPAPTRSGGYTGMVSLRVHQDDLSKAYRLLADMVDG